MVNVDPVNVTYGLALANSQLTGTATLIVGGIVVAVPGSFTFTSAAGTVPSVGNGQSESVTFTPTDGTDDSTVVTTVIVNVAAPRVTIAAVPLVTVTDVYWTTEKLTRQKSIKVLEVAFSGALDPDIIDEVGAFVLDAATKSKKLGTRYSKPVPFKNISYTPSTVTLTPRGKVPTQEMQLTINASLVLDAEGRQLDGNDDGQPGGNYVAMLNSHGLASAALPLVRTGRISARAVGALLLGGDLAARPSIRPGHLTSRR